MAPSNEAYAATSFTNPFAATETNPTPGPPLGQAPHFDILDWHPAYQSCQRYFLDHAQHEPATQALCALINIRLPSQWRISPIHSTKSRSVAAQSPTSSGATTMQDFPRATGAAEPTLGSRNGTDNPVFVSLIPYVRRLIVTGFDTEGILHGFFGDAWQAGISPLQECERRNYLFAAKHGGWGSCKKEYDLNEEETVPFMQPLKDVSPDELDSADRNWSSWMLMEDWMVGSRAPRQGGSHASGSNPTDGISRRTEGSCGMR